VPEGGSEEGEDPLDTIKRELKEEAGLTARNWREVLTLHLSNMMLDEVAYGYLASGLTVGDAEPEESEVLELKHLPFRTAFDMVMDGTITDAISVALILKVRVLAERGELPGDLNRFVKA
jgi:8-oxo-dGTP pyrophosphatase MutT (NUDIX family)